MTKFYKMIVLFFITASLAISFNNASAMEFISEEDPSFVWTRTFDLCPDSNPECTTPDVWQATLVVVNGTIISRTAVMIIDNNAGTTEKEALAYAERYFKSCKKAISRCDPPPPEGDL